MRRFISLIFILVIFQVNTQAQSNQSIDVLENNPLNSYSNKHFELATKKGAADQRSVIQLYDSIYSWKWEAGTGWTKRAKSIDMVYDENKNLTSKLTKYWTEGEWVNAWLEIFTYNDNNKINYLSRQWTGSSWMDREQQSFTYDLKHNKITETFRSFNGAWWNNLDSNIYVYDTNNNLMNEVCLDYYSNNWHNDWQYIYIYDASMVLIQVLEQEWSGGEWGDYQRTSFTYDSYNNLLNEVEQYWNGIDWINSHQKLYTYDAGNNRITEKTQYWYNYWSNTMQLLHTYDENHNLMTTTGQDWGSSGWKTYTRLRNSYDADNFKLSQVYTFCQNGDNVITGGDSTLYYFKTVLGINDLTVPEVNFSIYPNPSTTSITLSLPSTTPVNNTTLSIYNVNAQMVLSRCITEPVSVLDISMLPHGIYFVKITDDRMVEVGKFVKQ